MTLEEAIDREMEKSNEYGDSKVGKDYKQLAEWLKELKARRAFSEESIRDDANKIVWIAERVGQEKCLIQATEESAELAAALAKFTRCFSSPNGYNPTPDSYGKCLDHIYEEMADTKVALSASKLFFSSPRVKEIERQKIDRWYKRVFGGDGDEDE